MKKFLASCLGVFLLGTSLPPLVTAQTSTSRSPGPFLMSCATNVCTVSVDNSILAAPLFLQLNIDGLTGVQPAEQVDETWSYRELAAGDVGNTSAQVLFAQGASGSSQIFTLPQPSSGVVDFDVITGNNTNQVSLQNVPIRLTVGGSGGGSPSTPSQPPPAVGANISFDSPRISKGSVSTTITFSATLNGDTSHIYDFFLSKDGSAGQAQTNAPLKGTAPQVITVSWETPANSGTFLFEFTAVDGTGVETKGDIVINLGSSGRSGGGGGGGGGGGSRALIGLNGGYTLKSIGGNQTEEPKQVVEKEKCFPDITDEQALFVCYLVERGIIQGYGDGTFKPNRRINRAEYTKIVTLAEFSQEQIDQSFQAYYARLTQGNTTIYPDVPRDAWFAPYIHFSSVQDVVQGYGDGNFGPSFNINQAEALKISLETFRKSIESLDRFLDAFTVKEPWFFPYLSFASQAFPSAQILDGQPTRKVTRMDFAELTARLINAKEQLQE